MPWNKETKPNQTRFLLLLFEHVCNKEWPRKQLDLKETYHLPPGPSLGIRTEWLIVFWTFGIGGGAVRLGFTYWVELIIRRLRRLSWGMQTGALFGRTLPESRFVHVSHTKIALCRILTWGKSDTDLKFY